LPQPYKKFFDPLVGLTAAAAVTTKLKFGTSVCLVPELNPIILAKTIATLDRVSKGKFLFGVGWNAEEMADHGVDIADRWKVTRERILAMKEIWTKDVAEYHVQFVKFDPLWSWPKPIQPAGPPILLGSTSKSVARRVAEYCDGWPPIDASYAGAGGSADLAGGIEAIRVEAAKRERSIGEFDFTAITAFEMAPAGGLEKRIGELLSLGFNRVLFMAPSPAKPAEQWPAREPYAALIRNFP
jgi:probable F420-dependent oxidoreductase